MSIMLREKDKKMGELVRLVPFLKSYKGYAYFGECICLAQKNELLLTAIMKGLYLPVAIKYNTSSSCVERDIRTVCSIVWANGGKEAVGLWGYLNFERVPANKRCIEMILNILREEKMEMLWDLQEIKLVIRNHVKEEPCDAADLISG